MAEPPNWDHEYKSAKDYYAAFQIPLSILQLDPADRAVLRIAGIFLILSLTHVCSFEFMLWF